MKILCQRNPLWAEKKLGASSLSIGDYGCTSSMLAEINNRFGANATPADVAAHKEWYTSAGLILWPKLDLKFAIFEDMGRVYGFNEARVLEALNDPNNKAVGLEVNIPKAGKHWLKGDLCAGSLGW